MIYILSLLSIPSLFGMQQAGPGGVAQIVTLADVARKEGKSVDERLKALNDASQIARNLPPLSDNECVILSRALGFDVKSRAANAANSGKKTVQAISRLRTALVLAYTDAAPAIPEDATTTTTQTLSDDYFAQLGGRTRKVGEQRDEQRDINQTLKTRIQALEAELRQTLQALREKELDVAECSADIENLTNDLETTSLRLAEQATHNRHLRETLVQATEIKRKLEHDVKIYRERTEELAGIIEQLQALDA